MIVDLALAFLAGLLSFASTCVLPLVPAYVAYMGATSNGTTMTPRSQLKVLGNAALFVGGFATAFVALGASFGLIGADLKAYRPLLLQIAGAAIFLIGMGLLIFSNRLTVFNDFFPVVAVTTPFDSHFDSGNPTPAPHGAVQVGKPAPNFTLTDIDGHRVSLSQLKGKPVLINFWATWCVPCRDELPLIRDEYLAHRAEGFTVIAINFGDESSDTVRKFWSSHNLQPAPFLDPDGSVASSYGIALNNTGLPVSVLVARDGIISSYEPFPLTKDFIDAALANVLKIRRPP